MPSKKKTKFPPHLSNSSLKILLTIASSSTFVIVICRKEIVSLTSFQHKVTVRGKTDTVISNAPRSTFAYHELTVRFISKLKMCEKME